MELEHEVEELLQTQLYEHGLPSLHVEQVQKLAECTMQVYKLDAKRISLDRLYFCIKEYVQTPFGKKTLVSIGKEVKQRYNNILNFKSE